MTQFNSTFGNVNGNYAEQIVSRAIADWNNVVTSFNYSEDHDANPNNDLHNSFQLQIVIDDRGPGGRGLTDTFSFSANNSPDSATMHIDNDGGGFGWFFDPTPDDDAEFTAVVNSGAGGTGPAFQASFSDITANGRNFNDFYRTITHEIGHALGIDMGGPDLDALLSPAGTDQVDNVSHLYYFNALNKAFPVNATFTDKGGFHLYEGAPDPHSSFPNAPSDPHDLMNDGRTIPAEAQNSAPPIETTRQFISDLDAEILADVYGYTITLPSLINTAYASLDSLTGTLLVEGALSPMATATPIGATIQVEVIGSFELFPAASVTQIVIAENGGSDTVHVDSSLPMTLGNTEIMFLLSDLLSKIHGNGLTGQSTTAIATSPRSEIIFSESLPITPLTMSLAA